MELKRSKPYDLAKNIKLVAFYFLLFLYSMVKDVKDRTTVVITGFGPFGDVLSNPSQCILEDLKDSLTVEGGHHVVFRVLEVSAEHCDKLYDDEELRGGGQMVFIHLGEYFLYRLFDPAIIILLSIYLSRRQFEVFHNTAGAVCLQQ